MAATMEKQDRLVFGERLLVFGLLTALGLEGFFVILAAGIRFSWLGLLYGSACTVVVLLLADRLYAGNKGAQRFATLWAALQVGVSLLCLLALAFSPDEAGLTRHVALPVFWMALLKFLAYTGLGLILLMPQKVKDFIAQKRGETIAEPEPEPVLTPSGVTVTFSADQKEAFYGLGSSLRCVGGTLMTVGVLQILWSFIEIIRSRDAEQSGDILLSLLFWLVLLFLPGVLALLSGAIMFTPARAVRVLQDQGTDHSYLMQLVHGLRTFFRWHVLLALLGLLVPLTIVLIYALDLRILTP